MAEDESSAVISDINLRIYKIGPIAEYDLHLHHNTDRPDDDNAYSHSMFYLIAGTV